MVRTEGVTVIILVDFENTHASGLEGYTYLNESDTLVMYYSDENSAVTKGVVQDLRENGVHVRLVKLLKQHSNALDMYIASTTGMFLDSGEKICIVSKDRGYAAVRDFWHSLRGAEILLGETIKECLLNSELNDEARIRLCKEREQKASLVDAFTTMNTIPTRPTLSRNNQRRRRNDTRNFMEVSDPVAILPNPLITETPADQLAKELHGSTKEASEEAPAKNEKKVPKKAEEIQEKVVPVDAVAVPSAEAAKDTESAAAAEKTQNTKEEHTKRNDRNRRNSRKRDYAGDAHKPAPMKENTATEEPAGERFGGYDGIAKVNEASRIAMARRQERDELKAESLENTEKPQEKGREEQKPAQKTTALLRPEVKTTAVVKADPNRVQFVWDPISHSMKKVGALEDMNAAKNDPVSKTETVSSDLTKRTEEPVPAETPKTESEALSKAAGNEEHAQTAPSSEPVAVSEKPVAARKEASSEKKEGSSEKEQLIEKKASSETKEVIEKKISSETEEAGEKKPSSSRKKTAAKKTASRKKAAADPNASSEKPENAAKKVTASKKKQAVKKAELSAESPQDSTEDKKQSARKKSESPKTGRRRSSARAGKTEKTVEEKLNPALEGAEVKEATLSDTASISSESIS